MTASYITEPAFLIEDSHQLAKTDLTKCTLLMNIGPSQILFAVMDPHAGNLLSLKGYFFEAAEQEHSTLEVLDQCFDQNRILSTAFGDIRVMFDNPFFTIIPEPLFDPGLKSSYLNLLYPSFPDHSYHADHIASLKIVNVYAINKNIIGYLKKEFNSARYFHAETIFLASLQEESGSSKTRLYVRVQQGHITITLFKNGRLQMMQPYSIYYGADVYYFVLNAVGKLEAEDESVEIILSGQINQESSVYKELSVNIPRITWLKPPEKENYIRKFTKYPDHYFYTLLAMLTCG